MLEAEAGTTACSLLFPIILPLQRKLHQLAPIQARVVLQQWGMVFGINTKSAIRLTWCDTGILQTQLSASLDGTNKFEIISNAADCFKHTAHQVCLPGLLWVEHVSSQAAPLVKPTSQPTGVTNKSLTRVYQVGALWTGTVGSYKATV